MYVYGYIRDHLNARWQSVRPYDIPYSNVFEYARELFERLNYSTARAAVPAPPRAAARAAAAPPAAAPGAVAPVPAVAAYLALATTGCAANHPVG